MRTLISRSIIMGMFFSLVLTVLLATLFFLTFPLQDWLQLWESTFWNIPFVLIVLLISLIFGATVGFMIGVFGQNQLEAIEKGLFNLDVPKTDKTIRYDGPLDDVDHVIQRIGQVQGFIQEQTKRTQRLISERIENQQEKMEEVIAQERNRLARELHDSVSQELFAASMLVSAINEMMISDQNQTKKPLKQVETMIQQAQLEMRALLLHLRPIALNDNSLKQGMEQLLQELKQKVPINMDWKVDDVTLGSGVEDHLFRILQESVSNTLRHAKATSIDILLVKREYAVILRVMDDGVGFDVTEKQSSSYGLHNMSERAAEIGAKLKVVSVPNKGTRLEVRVPIMEAEGDEGD
ncbi:sensor histidine kinase LiaS [Paraliobacillus ryukyuensis]|uniref:Sensor histidine kinase n=1 Tax=Paraliobacillus ryukyuensis TaxID=200904 RepID=A0A366EDI7_9BACI|nr:sensor histidine kinase [Paraliobacillus ryukyuensis]RBP00471.1 NarL family two-component system sensor histidine kinase LiaS [Paraliobacillus ryukyuensis]